MLLRPDALLADGGGDLPAPKKTGPKIGSAVPDAVATSLSKQFANVIPTSKTTSIGGISLPTASTQTSYMPSNMSTTGKTSSTKSSSPSLIDKALAAPAQVFHNILGGFTAGAVSNATAGQFTPKVEPLDTKKAASITKSALGEVSGVAPAKRALTGTSTPTLGSKGIGTALDVASALPFIGIPGKAAAATGALGKTAKEIGAIQAAGEAAKVAKASAAGKVGSGIAAGVLAASPVTHAAADVKPITKITQSVDAAKGVKTGVKNVKTSVAPKTSVKTAAEDVTFTPKTVKTKTAAERASQNAKISQAAVDVSSASKLGQFKVGTVDHTKSETKKDVKNVQDVKDIKKDVQNVNDIRNVDNTKKFDSQDNIKDKSAKESKDVKDIKDIKNVKDINTYDYNQVQQKQDINKVDQTVSDGGFGGKESGKKEEVPPRQFVPVMLPTTSDVEELNRKRKWNPSAIV